MFPNRSRLKAAFLILTLAYLPQAVTSQVNKPVRIGILTDIQYCDCKPDGDRYYRLSLPKLDNCIRVLNGQKVDAIFHLGDMIDHDYDSYDSILPRLQRFRPKVNLVLGNHDYLVKKKYQPGLTAYLGMKEDHYVVDIRGWRLIVLNGDDLSFVAPQDKAHKRERNEIVSSQYFQQNFNGLPWNGGIGRDQLNWLKMKLDESEQEGRKVIILCHFPLYSKEDHNLFNNKQVFHLISRYACVKAYFCGHYHSGSYAEKEGIQLVNFRGMVDTRQGAFAVVTLTNDSILIKGYGREPDRRLKVR